MSYEHDLQTKIYALERAIAELQKQTRGLPAKFRPSNPLRYDVVARVDSARSGQKGRYNITVYEAREQADATGNLSESNLGTALATTGQHVGWLVGDIVASSNSITTFPQYLTGMIAGGVTGGGLLVRLNGGGGSSLPTPTAHRQVLACTRFVSTSDYDVAFTFLEAT